MFGLPRAGDHDVEAAFAEQAQQLGGALGRTHLGDQPFEVLGVAAAYLVADALRNRLAGQVGDDPVAAHADRAVDAVARRLHPHLAERGLPGDGAGVHAVDQRAVHVQDDGVDCHEIPSRSAFDSRTRFRDHSTPSGGSGGNPSSAQASRVRARSTYAGRLAAS